MTARRFSVPVVLTLAVEVPRTDDVDGDRASAEERAILFVQSIGEVHPWPDVRVDGMETGHPDAVDGEPDCPVCGDLIRGRHTDWCDGGR